MAKPVRMPALGQTSDELRVSSWMKSLGDHVQEGEPLLEIETDKANLEVESSSSGVLLTTLFGPGDVVDAGTVIAWVGEPGEQPPSTADQSLGPVTGEAGAPPRQAGATVVSQPSPVADGGAHRKPTSPAARALARQIGVDISSVVGTGPGGRVEKHDVTAHANGPPGLPAKADGATWPWR
jgi:2-oxoglutarate dehydrogenase E2 component (dihydrolipoamide succinyltransferase)